MAAACLRCDAFARARASSSTSEIVCRTSEADRRYDNKRSEDNHTFLFIVDRGVVIDAGCNGNDSRYINHSCDPNCESVIEDRRVFIEAVRTIQPGDELTYDYQIGRDKDDPPNVDQIFACRCGARSCRGTMLWPAEAQAARADVKAKQLSGAAVLGAMGVVYGDIGTSPLYALEASLNAAGAPMDRSAVLGVLSLIFWSLLIVVTLKYVVLIMSADNDGEGGILSLFALVERTLTAGTRWQRTVVILAALGAALFYCDALITPAISVLSAVEGLENLNPDTASAVVPVTLLIIIALFAIQHRGTERVGRLFGPIMALWFVVLAVTGVIAMLKNPAVLAALSPGYGLVLLVHRPGVALAILGGVFLAMTGGEALYADMGHFGKRAGARRLVFHGLAGPGAELLRPGRHDPRPPGGGAPAALPARAGECAAVHGAAGNGRHHHRLAGHDHRRLLGHASMHPARSAAAVANSRRPRHASTARSTCRQSIGSCCWRCACSCWASAPRPHSELPMAPPSPEPCSLPRCSVRNWRWRNGAGRTGASLPCSGR